MECWDNGVTEITPVLQYFQFPDSSRQGIFTTRNLHLYERDFACYKRMKETMRQRNHIHRLHAKGERQYQRLRSKLEPRYKGHILAIEVESGEYVLGKDELKVALKAVKKFPGKKFSFFRIGYPAVHKLRLHLC